VRRIPRAPPGASVQLGEDHYVAFQTTHPRLHVTARPLPLVHLPLELLDLRPLLVTAGRRALPIALPSLLFAPFHQLILRHGRDGRGSVIVLGLVEEGGLLLGRALGRRRCFVPDLALFRGRSSGLSWGGGHVCRMLSNSER